MSKIADMTGLRFGKLVVTGRKVENGRGYWICACDCGNETVARTDSLKSGHTSSCGCVGLASRQEALTKHGYWGSRLYNTWHGMIQRCTNPNSRSYSRYGGRGIRVCTEWRNSFEAFCDWATANGYSDELTIDRIDVNGNYEPSNCRWATKQEQANNRRTSSIIAFKGESHTLAEWSRITGIKRSTIVSRLAQGWEIERVLTEKPHNIKG